MSAEDLEGGGASKSTDPASGTSAATDVSLREYGVLRANLQRRLEELDRDWMWRFLEERDRRYAEVQRERDKAEVIRASTQAYRDEKANELREQINSERGRYVTLETFTATIEPILKFVAGEQGSRQGGIDQRQIIAWVVAAALGLLALAQFLA